MREGGLTLQGEMGNGRLESMDMGSGSGGASLGGSGANMVGIPADVK